MVKHNRMIAAFTALFMVITLAVPTAVAENLPDCHKEHDEKCGYVAEVKGVPCGHICDWRCYESILICEETDEKHEHGKACYELVTYCKNEDEKHEHGETCWKKKCIHEEHDKECGYVEAVKGVECAHTCDVCNPPEPEEKIEPQAEEIPAEEEPVEEIPTEEESAEEEPTEETPSEGELVDEDAELPSEETPVEGESTEEESTEETPSEEEPVDEDAELPAEETPIEGEATEEEPAEETPIEEESTENEPVDEKKDPVADLNERIFLLAGPEEVQDMSADEKKALKAELDAICKLYYSMTDEERNEIINLENLIDLYDALGLDMPQPPAMKALRKSVKLMADPPANTYTLYVPETVTAVSGYSALSGGIKVSGDVDSGKTVAVKAESENNWNLVSGDKKVKYDLRVKDSNTSSVTFTFDANAVQNETAKDVGVYVAASDYNSAEAGNYSDVITFTASLN